MKKSLFYLLLVVVFAAWIATLVARDAGYVLVAYDGATLQTGLWVMLAMLCGLGLLAFLLFRTFYVITGMGKQLNSWKINQQRNKSAELTFKGLMLLQEGDFERAEKFLVSGAKNGISPAHNFISAAKAVDQQGKSEQRERYLAKAISLNSKVSQAIAVASAEMAAERGEWQSCLDYLENCELNKLTLSLQKKALLKLADWQSLALLIPQLRKIESAANLDALERRLVLEQLSLPDSDDEVLLSLYKNSSAPVRSDEGVLLALSVAVTKEKEKEAILRASLKKTWHPALVEVYGSLGKETLKRRLKMASSWLKAHPQDAALQFCLGQLYDLSGDRDKAKACYEQSIVLGKNSRAGLNLAKLLAFEGDFEKSNEYLLASGD